MRSGWPSRSRPRGVRPSSRDASRRLRIRLTRSTRSLFSCNSADDVPQNLASDDVEVLYGPAGLTKQRNNALAHLPANTDLVIFFDDDFVAHRDYVKAMVALFSTDGSIAGATGEVVADGINGKAIEFEAARNQLRAISVDMTKPTLVENFSPYGCNMAFRCASLSSLTFDERLVLYGWQEDRDFGAQVARRGRIVRLSTACGIHLGFRGGRVPGLRLGYSQVVNPLLPPSKEQYGALDGGQSYRQKHPRECRKVLHPEGWRGQDRTAEG